MTTFNFTVRATDDAGAFADRAFAITVNNTKIENFVAINATDAYSSSNGINWTIRPGAGGTRVRWGAGQWCVLVPDGSIGGCNSYRTSSDGINFTTRTFPVEMGQHIYYSYEINKWLIVSQADYTSTTNSVAYTSVDLINWTIRSTVLVPTGVTTAWNGPMAYGNGTWFVFGAGGDTYIGWKSTNDGVSWTEFTPSYASNYSISDVKYVNGLWIATNAYDNIIYTSIDANTWVPNTFTITDTNMAYDFGAAGRIAYGNGRLLVSLHGYNTSYPGSSDKILTSLDAKTFTQANIQLQGSAGVFAPSVVNHNIATYNDVAYGQGVFVLVKNATTEIGILPSYIPNTISYSYDGVNWTATSIGDPYSIVSLASTSEI